MEQPTKCPCCGAASVTTRPVPLDVYGTDAEGKVYGKYRVTKSQQYMCGQCGGSWYADAVESQLPSEPLSPFPAQCSGG